MICPLCGQQHIKGTDYCPVLLAKIPVLKPSTERGRLEDSGNDVESDCSLAVCANCGYMGIAGEQCDQCGQIIASEKIVLASMPDGSEIQLPVSREIVIGRESSWAEVADALSRCDGVSRRHCSMRFDTQGKCATVIDLGSTNGTWIGPSCDPLMPNEVFTGRLPIELHLGKRAVIILREC